MEVFKPLLEIDDGRQWLATLQTVNKSLHSKLHIPLFLSNMNVLLLALLLLFHYPLIWKSNDNKFPMKGKAKAVAHRAILLIR